MKRTGLKKLRNRPPGRYKTRLRRVDWKQQETGEAPTMVRGTNRRVIVVKSPDPQVFEEAIFVIREDLFHREQSAEKVLQQAQKAAGAYLRTATPPRRRWLRFRLPAPVYAAAGAVAAAIAWLAIRFVGV